ALPVKSTRAVAISFPALFRDDEARQRFIQEAKEMSTMSKERGFELFPAAPETSNPSSVEFDANDMIAKSFYRALELRALLCSNENVGPFWFPPKFCLKMASLAFCPLHQPPLHHVTVDLAIMNPVVKWPYTPWIYWQGNNFGRMSSPMIKVSV